MHDTKFLSADNFNSEDTAEPIKINVKKVIRRAEGQGTHNLPGPKADIGRGSFGINLYYRSFFRSYDKALYPVTANSL